MIDFFKAHLTDFDNSILLNHPLLDFSYEMNPETGVAKPRKNRESPSQIAEFKNLKFELFESGTMTIEGSLHKFWNHGYHNFDDFDLIDVIQALEEIQDIFDIHPSQMILRRVELGINFTPPYPTNSILESLILHKTERLFLGMWTAKGMY